MTDQQGYSELDAMMGTDNGLPASDAGEKKTKKAKGAKKEPKEKKVKEPKPKRDNISLVNNMSTIGSVRKALQIAIAKKAKAAGKPETQARYDTEIENAKAKLQSMLDSAKTLKDLLDLGEEPNRVITRFIAHCEENFDAWLAANGYKVSKNTLKGVSDDLPESFFTDLPMAMHDTLIGRHSKSDYRLRASCRNFNFKAGVEAGVFVFQNNKWVNTQAPVEAEAEAPTESI